MDFETIQSLPWKEQLLVARKWAIKNPKYLGTNKSFIKWCIRNKDKLL